MRQSLRVPPTQRRPISDDEITLPFRIVCERKEKESSESDRGDRQDEDGTPAEPSDEDSVAVGAGGRFATGAERVQRES